MVLPPPESLMMFHTVINFACLTAEANLMVGLLLHRISLGGALA